MTEPQPEQPALLVVEDDISIASLLQGILETAGYRVVVAGSGFEARHVLEHVEPDLILLDLMLPDTDGLILATTIKTLRATPIIVLTARTEQVDRILAFKLGADDFVAKPFDPEELLARVAAVLRRATHEQSAAHEPAGRIIVDGLTIVHARHQVTLDGESLHLTPTEYRLLLALASRANQPVSPTVLIAQVWGYADARPGHLIDTHLWRLRRKLRTGGPGPHIVTVRGGGYMLTSQESEPRENVG